MRWDDYDYPKNVHTAHTVQQQDLVNGEIHYWIAGGEAMGNLRNSWAPDDQKHPLRNLSA